MLFIAPWLSDSSAPAVHTRMPPLRRRTRSAGHAIVDFLARDIDREITLVALVVGVVPTAHVAHLLQAGARAFVADYRRFHRPIQIAGSAARQLQSKMRVARFLLSGVEKVVRGDCIRPSQRFSFPERCSERDSGEHHEPTDCAAKFHCSYSRILNRRERSLSIRHHSAPWRRHLRASKAIPPITAGTTMSEIVVTAPSSAQARVSAPPITLG